MFGSYSALPAAILLVRALEARKVYGDNEFSWSEEQAVCVETSCRGVRDLVGR